MLLSVYCKVPCWKHLFILIVIILILTNSLLHSFVSLPTNFIMLSLVFIVCFNSMHCYCYFFHSQIYLSCINIFLFSCICVFLIKILQKSVGLLLRMSFRTHCDFLSMYLGRYYSFFSYLVLLRVNLGM